jgi:hypothetical protein
MVVTVIMAMTAMTAALLGTSLILHQGILFSGSRASCRPLFLFC